MLGAVFDPPNEAANETHKRCVWDGIVCATVVLELLGVWTGGLRNKNEYAMFVDSISYFNDLNDLHGTEHWKTDSRSMP